MSNYMTPKQAIFALEDCYREYAEKWQALQARMTVKETLAGWVGGGTIKEAQGKLYEDYQGKGHACVLDLCAALSECGQEETEQWVWQAMETILFYPEDDSDFRIMLVAMESLAEPLFPLLKGAPMKELIRRYRKRTPKYRMLPNQSELLKKMRQYT